MCYWTWRFSVTITKLVAISQGNFNLFSLAMNCIYNPFTRRRLRITAPDEYLSISTSLNAHRRHGLARVLEQQLDSVKGAATFTSKIRDCITDRCTGPPDYFIKTYRLSSRTANINYKATLRHWAEQRHNFISDGDSQRWPFLFVTRGNRATRFNHLEMNELCLVPVLFQKHSLACPFGWGSLRVKFALPYYTTTLIAAEHF